MKTPFNVSFRARPENVRLARDAVAAIAASLGAPPGVIDDVRLCVSEAATNTVRHAYGDADGALWIKVDERDEELTVVVCDDGGGLEGFRREGELGHGLRIMGQLASRFTVTSAPRAGTQVRMVFPLRPRMR